MKKLSIIIIITVCISLLSCSAGISRDEADIMARDFIDKLIESDIEGATAMMHPGTNTTEELLEAYIDAVEAGEGITFSEIDEIETLTNFSSAVYSSDVGGSYYRINYKLAQDETEYECMIEIIKVDDVTGVSNITIDPK